MDPYLQQRWKQQKECIEKEYELICKLHKVLNVVSKMEG